MRSRMNGMFHVLSAAALLGTAFAFSGCSEKDLYNPNAVQEATRNAFPVKDVDPYHTWETSQVCKATVSINDKSGETYTVYVLKDNPYGNNAANYSLGSAKMKNGETTTFTFDAPNPVSTLYVMKQDSRGYTSVMPVTVEDGEIYAGFGVVSSSTRANTRMESYFGVTFNKPEKPSEPSNPYSEPSSEYFPTSAPSDCGNVANYYQTLNTIPYSLTSGTYDEVNCYMGAILYVEGNVTIKDWKDPGDGSWEELSPGVWGTNPYPAEFYLLPNAVLTIEESFSTKKHTTFSIGEGAKLIIKGDFSTNSNTKIYSKGTIEANNITINSDCELYYTKSITTGNFNLGSNVPFYCGGSLRAGYVDFNSGKDVYIEDDLTVSGKLVVEANIPLYVGGNIEAASVNFGQNGSAYTPGDVTIEGTLQTEANTQFYCGGEVSATEFKLVGGSDAYCEGRITLTGDLNLTNDGSEFYTKDSLTVKNIAVVNSLIYNDGGLGAVSIDLSNNDSKLYNSSTGRLYISDEFKVTNGSFRNDAEGKVIVEKTISNSVGKWENLGHYVNTGDFEVSANNRNNYNRCWLQIDGNLKLSDGGIINDSYIKTATMYMNNGRVVLTDKAFLEVTGTATLNYNSPYNGNGIIGPTGTRTDGENERALVKMAKGTYSNGAGDWHITYDGLIYIDCSDHFSFVVDPWNNCGSCVNGAEFIEIDKTTYSVTPAECMGAYNYKETPAGDSSGGDSSGGDSSGDDSSGGDSSGDDSSGGDSSGDDSSGGDSSGDDSSGGETGGSTTPTPVVVTPQVYTYLFEDLSRGAYNYDYDFNDVVLYVTVPYDKYNNGKKYIDVTLMAAGGGHDAYVYFSNNGISEDVFGEVHDALGHEERACLINTVETDSSTDPWYAGEPPVTKTYSVGENFNLTKDGDFYIYSDNKRYVSIPEFTSGFQKGDVPYAVRIAAKCPWPKERIDVSQAFDFFELWAADALKNPDWYNYPKDGQVIYPPANY